MTQMKSRKIITGLQRKNFLPTKSKSDHLWYYLLIDGKLDARIRLKISHGKKGTNIHRGILNSIIKSLKLDSIEQFTDLVECPMSYKVYIKHLKENNYI